MKLLLDQGLPRSAIGHLQDLGHTAEHVGDLGMARATDEDIMEAAVDREAVVVTLDSDFHALLAATNAERPSVIRIRNEGLKGDDLAKILDQVIQVARSELEDGSVASVTERHVRVRSLPIGG